MNHPYLYVYIDTNVYTNCKENANKITWVEPKMLVNDSKIVCEMYVCTLYIRCSNFVCLNEPSTHTYFLLLYFHA